MNTPTSPLAVLLVLALGVHAAGQTPTTTPHWSTYFGSTQFDETWVVKRGPGSLITIAGHSDSDGLATSGAWQPTRRGLSDGFVARIDPTLPPALQLRWCTYVGGVDREMVFDAEVDAVGNITIVGLTLSDAASFPLVNAFQNTRHGASDGFVATISANGQQCTLSSYLGSDLHDRLSAIELTSNGTIVVAGVAEGPGLPATTGPTWTTVGPVPLGGTDAFVARIDPTTTPARVLWSTYLGGPQNEGAPLASWLTQGSWPVIPADLKSASMLLEANGDVVVVTPSRSATAPITAGCVQPVHGGGNGVNNVYLVRLNPSGTARTYATFFGGSGNHPWAVARHPAGGQVIVGGCLATNMTTTTGCFQPAALVPGNGFLCWIDGPQLRYATYFGGNTGGAALACLAIETSGLVTIGGRMLGGGNFVMTPGCHQPGAFGWAGVVARLDLRGNSSQDLLYATYVGNDVTYVHDLGLDEFGDVLLTGATDDASYPTTPNALQLLPGGNEDAVITHLPLLPGGTTRLDKSLAVPACPRVLYAGALGAPFAGNSAFELTATNAPPGGVGGVLGLGFSPPAGGPWPLENIKVLVDPTVIVGPFAANGLGFAHYLLPIPPNLAPGFVVQAQWAFFTNAACPGTGQLASSERLQLTTL